MDAGKDKNKALSIKMSPCSKQEKEVERKSQQKSMIFCGVILLAIFLGLVLIKQNSNDISLVKTYLKKNFINAKDNQGNTQLYYACEDDNIEDVEILLKLGADVNEKNSLQWTPLHMAAYYGRFEIAKLLIQNGANIDAKCDDLVTPLHFAADNGQCGHSKTAELLLQNGADVDAQDKVYDTPLHDAAFNGYPEVVEVLLKHGARKDLKNQFGRTPLQVAEYYKRGDYKKVIALLKEN